MKIFSCSGFNSVRAESISEAALRFANRAARRAYGSRGYCRTCTMGSYKQDFSSAEFSAFIGITTGPHVTTGHNIILIVYQE